MTLFDMSGKVAIITGSSRGIGRAIAERMAEHGAKVVISSRKQQVCDEVAKAINDKAGKQTALAVAANISTKDDLKHLVEETNRAFGKIDTLVCNAASNCGTSSSTRRRTLCKQGWRWPATWAIPTRSC